MTPVLELVGIGSGRPFGRPVSQLDILFNLAALVAMFLGFCRPVVGLTKRRFGVSDDFSDGVYRFAHTNWFPFIEMSPKLGECQRMARGELSVTTASKSIAPKLMVRIGLPTWEIGSRKDMTFFAQPVRKNTDQALCVGRNLISNRTRPIPTPLPVGARAATGPLFHTRVGWMKTVI